MPYSKSDMKKTSWFPCLGVGKCFSGKMPTDLVFVEVVWKLCLAICLRLEITTELYIVSLEAMNKKKNFIQNKNSSFCYIHCSGQFISTSLVLIDSGVVVSQHCLEYFFMK